MSRYTTRCCCPSNTTFAHTRHEHSCFDGIRGVVKVTPAVTVTGQHEVDTVNVAKIIQHDRRHRARRQQWFDIGHLAPQFIEYIGQVDGLILIFEVDQDIGQTGPRHRHFDALDLGIF